MWALCRPSVKWYQCAGRSNPHISCQPFVADWSMMTEAHKVTVCKKLVRLSGILYRYIVLQPLAYHSAKGLVCKPTLNKNRSGSQCRYLSPRTAEPNTPLPKLLQICTEHILSRMCVNAWDLQLLSYTQFKPHSYYSCYSFPIHVLTAITATIIITSQFISSQLLQLLLY